MRLGQEGLGMRLGQEGLRKRLGQEGQGMGLRQIGLGTRLGQEGLGTRLGLGFKPKLLACTFDCIFRRCRRLWKVAVSDNLVLYFQPQ